VTCPDCGHSNMEGVDVCEHCGQSLSAVDQIRPKTNLHRAITETPLRELDPVTALTVPPSEPMARVIKLMQQNRQGSVLVVDGGKLVGIFTERDLVNRLTGKPRDLNTLPVSEVMTKDPRALKEDDTLAFAMHRMAVGHYRHVPIVTPGKPLRFVSVRGVLRYLHENAR
jgi:CBS domain-containing protein